MHFGRQGGHAPHGVGDGGAAGHVHEGVRRYADVLAQSFGENLSSPFDQPLRRLKTGTHGGAAQGDLAQEADSTLQARLRAGEDPCVAAEYVTKGDGQRILQMGAAGLHDTPVPLRLCLPRIDQTCQLRHQFVPEKVDSRQVQGRRDRVIARLTEVHVIVRVYEGVFTDLTAELLVRQVCDHLVHVHVRGGARSGLEHVKGKLILKLARSDFGCRAPDGVGFLLVQVALLTRCLDHGGLDGRQGFQQGPRHPSIRYRQIEPCPLCVGAPERSGRDPHLSHGIPLDT